MKFKGPLVCLISLVLGGQSLYADGYHTGLQDLSIADAEGGRPLEGYIWYPTQQSDGQTEAHGNAVWESISVARDAAPEEGSHPLVVLSHGMFGNARNQAWLGEALVEQGYIVAAINHPGTSTFLRDPDHQRELWERPRDISRTIDYILETPALSRLVDEDRIFMAGHSLGGFTAIALAGGRFDADKMDQFCAEHPGELVCGIFDRWDIAKTPEDRTRIGSDLSDPRINGFAVFDLGGTQSFSLESLGAIARPMLVYGAPLDIMGMDLEIESHALIAALPEENVRYLEPVDLSHFDFLGVCTERGLAILQAEEPEDAFICEQGREERRLEHSQIAQEVSEFFGSF